MSVLAVLGGSPTMGTPLDESAWPEIDDDDIDAVVATMRSGRLSWATDSEVGYLEKEFADFVGTRHAVAVNSGTAALHAALAAVGVGPGDHVLVPALSFMASGVAVLHQRAEPVFVDIDPVTFTIDPEDLERRVTPRSAAIVAVHLHGLPADMSAIRAVAARRGLAVIEDAAQAHGATCDGEQVGSLGDIAAFSIMAGKNLPTAGEGGLVTTNDRDLRNRADAVKMFGVQIGADGEVERGPHTLGYNYRLSPILASVARSQLAKLDTNTAQVRAGARRLTERLEGIPGIAAPAVPEGRTHVYHHFRVRVVPEEIGPDLDAGRLRQALEAALSAEGVPVGSYQTRPLPEQPAFEEHARLEATACSCGAHREPRYRGGDYPTTREVIRSSFVVGSRLCMASLRDMRNVDLIADAFEKVLGQRDDLVALARTMDDVEPWDAPAALW